jgi:hypothetical protein
MQCRGAVSFVNEIQPLDGMSYVVTATIALLVQWSLAERTAKVCTLPKVVPFGMLTACPQFFLHRRALRSAFLVIIRTMIVLAWMLGLGPLLSPQYPESLYKPYSTCLPAMTISVSLFVSRKLTNAFTYATIGGAWAFVSAAVDSLITASLIYVLRQEVRGFNQRTDTILKKC